MEAERAVAVCNGKLCFNIVATQRADQGDAHPCPFIRARHGIDDLCRCCKQCEKACRDDI